MTYTIENAVAIAARLEPLIFARFNLHLAIGGSLVYRGHSEKDIDVFIYPHNKEVVIDRNAIWGWLEGEGFNARIKTPVNEDGQEADFTQVPDVLMMDETATGYKVDFFFMERHTVNPTIPALHAH